MPITQDRLISLIEIADEALRAQARQRAFIQAEVSASVASFHENGGSQNPLAAELLARLQSIDAILSEPLISLASIETLATEREHFRALSRHNTRSAKAMKKRRALTLTNQTQIE